MSSLANWQIHPKVNTIKGTGYNPCDLSIHPKVNTIKALGLDNPCDLSTGDELPAKWTYRPWDDVDSPSAMWTVDYRRSTGMDSLAMWTGLVFTLLMVNELSTGGQWLLGGVDACRNNCMRPGG